jgi:hypothetical protein
MRRRGFLLAMFGLLPIGSGCLGRGNGTQPKTVPLHVLNNSPQKQHPTVTFAAEPTDEAVFSKTIALASGDVRRFTVGPIHRQRRYAISYELGNRSAEEVVPGDGLRAAELKIRESGRVGMTISASET